ncbi:MAG: gliding motility protein GldM, partial [Bacteroidetes bacterium]|nr:gliding motility protein GldM [Bacteroidota bacterium]
GLIKIKDPEGQDVTYPFSHEYIVAPPSLTVAATKMNVFYIGVDNPVSISVPGIAKERIRPSISVGSISPDPASRGDWIVKVPSGARKAVVSATAEYQGQVMNMGSSEFRVKKVPDPVAEIAGMIQGAIEKNTLLAAGAIIPEMKDFEFDLYFKVTSFKMITIIGGDLVQKNARGNQFTSEITSIIQSARRGQRILFENIQAEGPDGIRSLNPINLEIK